jgi:hypothetical protein
VSPTPEPTTLSETHELLERFLSRLWNARAYLAELQGEIEAAREELEVLRTEAFINEDYRRRRIEEVEDLIRRFTASAQQKLAEVSSLESRVQEVRALREWLLPPPEDADLSDIATVTCDGDRTGGTHLSTPVVRAGAHGAHVRVVNRFTNERAFLIVNDEVVYELRPAMTAEVLLQGRASRDVEILCTYDKPPFGFPRPTHPLWIEDPPRCADDIDRLDAAPVEDLGSVSVYFSCEADADLLGTEDQPVYLFTRSVPEGTAGTGDERLEAALRSYVAGPTRDEIELGYFTPAPPSLGPAIQAVSISEGIATVDFDGAAIGDLGGLGTSTASLTFLIELRAVTFQFPEVQQLVLQVDGDCDSFWHMLEMSCQTIRRYEGCPIPRYLATRLPWVPLGTMIPGPERVEDRLGSALVWFEDEDLRWSGGYVSLKRSSRPLIDEDLSGFPAVQVQEETAHLVWIGDPGVGALALVWSEGVQPCSWFSLSMSTAGLTESEAQNKIRVVARFLSDFPPGSLSGL